MRQIGYRNAMRASLLAAICGVLAISIGACGGGGGGGAAPATVIGRIVLVSSGQPLNGATVSAGGKSYVTGSGALGDGNFILQNASSDATTLTVTGTGVKTLTQTLEPLTPNQTNDLGDIYVLDTSDATADYKADVKGVVVRSDTFAPVAGAKVRFSGHVATTGANGAFQFTGLPVGLGTANAYVGDITATGFAVKQITLDALVLGASPPVNDLGDIAIAPPVTGTTPPPPSNINGKVSLQGQTDLSGTTVTLVNKSGGASVGTVNTASDGKYGFFVVAGTYTVRVSHAGFTSQQVDVTLPRPDQVQTKDFTLVP
jgi:hypothetical protein